MAARRRVSAITAHLCSLSPTASASIPAGSGAVSGADSTATKAPLRTAAKTIRLGIVGVGNMGGGHLSNIEAGDCPSVVVTALCDTDPARLARHEGKGYALFADSDELLKSDTIDSVLIATPHYSHTTIGVAALAAGYHVMVEKPISVHKEDCEKLIAAYEARPDKSKLFSAMFVYRCQPLYVKLKQLLEGGELGEIKRVNWIVTDWFRSQAYYDSGGWRATWSGEGGGVLLNQCPHQLDLFQWLFGMPTQVVALARLGKWHDIEVEDDVSAICEFENGASGIFTTTTGEAPGTNRLEIIGERGAIVAEHGPRHDSPAVINFFRNEWETGAALRGEGPGGSSDAPTVMKTEVPLPAPSFPNVANPDMFHAAILENFAINAADPTIAPPLISPAVEGIRSVELGNGILMSGLSGSKVDFPLDGAKYATLLQQLVDEAAAHKAKATAEAEATGSK